MGKGNNNRQKTRPHMDFGGAVREIGVFVALIIMVIIFALIDPSYVTVGNFVDIVKQATINGILAIGITFAIISGGIDLSLGSTFAIVIVAVGQLTVMGIPPLAAIAAGADGLMIETHPCPEKALSDGPQSLTFDEFDGLMNRLRPYAGLSGRTF